MKNFSEKIEVQNKKKYLIFRYLLFAVLLVAILFLALNFLFPSERFYLDATDPGRKSNTIAGLEKKENYTQFYATTQGSFSEVRINIESEEKFPENPEVKVRNGYRAFFYPEGDPMGWRNGTLLQSNGKYFIVSDGKLREFSSESVLANLGFQKDSFRNIPKADLQYNFEGEKIIQNYPEFTNFKIEEIYYQLRNEKLHPFISEKAFLTQYTKNSAIEKQADFFKEYEESEKFLGFIDGTLLTFGGSVFLISEDKIYPIDDPVTFELSGYGWNDLLPATSEEMSIYEKQDTFDINAVHPEGTVIFAKDNKKYYYIQDKTKREIPTKNIKENYSNGSIITAEEKSLNMKENCNLSDSALSYGYNYNCEIFIDELDDLAGKDWQFKLSPQVNMDEIHLTFSRKINTYNFLDALGDVKNNIMLKYGFYE